MFFLATFVEIMYNIGVMERKPHFYVSYKNILTWLMALCMVCSAVARILDVGGKGPDLWSQIVLPVAACLLYVVIALMFGKENFYKTAIPVWMICVYYFTVFADFDFTHYRTMIVVLYAIVLLFIAVLYTQITAGKERLTLALIPLQVVPLCALAYLNRAELMAGNYLSLLPDALMTLGLVIIVFAIQVHPMDEYHPTWGDRVDGRKIRTLAPMAQITAFFQVERNTCSNLFEEAFEITHIESYIRQ